MPNQHTKKLTNTEKKVVRPATEISNEALLLAKKTTKTNGDEKLGNLPDFSQECTGCTTLRLEITKLKDKVSTLEAVKAAADDRSDLLKMVSEAIEESKAQQKLPTAVLENLQERLNTAESDIKNIYAITMKVHGTTKVSQL